jgi:Spy/CpxP family protein refolding chaperone
MNIQLRTFAIMLSVTVLAAAAAGWAGVRYGLQQSEQSQNIDAVLHHELELTPDQDRQLEVLETAFSKDRALLQKEMRAANIELARAITQEHVYEPDARRAIDHFHVAMRALQEKTIQHVLGMRALLTPSQAKVFDKSVNYALGAEEP